MFRINLINVLIGSSRFIRAYQCVEMQYSDICGQIRKIISEKSFKAFHTAPDNHINCINWQLPVLMIFWIALATCPWRRELRSLTSSRRQVQSTSSEEDSRIKPTARSDNPVSTNRWVPAPIHTCIYIFTLLWKCARQSRIDRHVFILTVISPSAADYGMC